MTHHPSAASLRLHGARLLFPPVATLLFLVLTEYIARGALSGDTFVQYIFPHPEAYLLAWGLLFLVWMAVDWLTRFAPLATLLSALLGCLPATVDFYILQLRGEPFLPWDLMQVSEAAGVASAAGIHVQKSMVVSGVVVLALTVGSFFLYRGRQKLPWVQRLAGFAASTAATCALIFGVFLQPAVTQSLGILPDAWMQDRYYRYYGVITSFLTNLTNLEIDKPEAYSEEAVNAILDDVEAGEKYTTSPAWPDSYAAQMGVSRDEVVSYIEKMDDETLFSYVEDMVREQIAAQYAEATRAQLSSMTVDQLAAALDMTPRTEEQTQYLYDNYMPATVSDSTYDDVLAALGYVDLASPSKVSLYAATFADKDAIADCIADYNKTVSDEQEITYTDYVALLMSSITTIINAISYVLIAFVSISLIVSSIMIGIITYISVLERTKEIGILRAIGASKRDISRVFNAETLIEGLIAGLIGIGLTLLLIIPINAIVQHLTGIASLGAVLPPVAAVLLVAISMLLTFIAGLIPSRLAAKKDPVVALRTE